MNRSFHFSISTLYQKVKFLCTGKYFHIICLRGSWMWKKQHSGTCWKEESIFVSSNVHLTRYIDIYIACVAWFLRPGKTVQKRQPRCCRCGGGSRAFTRGSSCFLERACGMRSSGPLSAMMLVETAPHDGFRQRIVGCRQRKPFEN